jgi:ferredoxin
MPNVTFTNWGRTVKAGPLANLRAVAQHAGISLHDGVSRLLNCGGHGLCKTCRVDVLPVDGPTPKTAREKGCRGLERLACQARIRNGQDLVVTKRTGFKGRGPDPVRPD